MEYIDAGAQITPLVPGLEENEGAELAILLHVMVLME
jgi:hypothetical protein